MSVCFVQIQLSVGLLSHYLSTITSMCSNAVQLMDLYFPVASLVPTVPSRAATANINASELPPAVPSFSQLNSSSSFAESPHFLAVPATMTSESISLEMFSTEGSRANGVELSVWLQWTLLKFVINMYGRSQGNKGQCGFLMFFRMSTHGSNPGRLCLLPSVGR